MKRPTLGELEPHYDLIVIGGGITGAGILVEAARGGAKALLLEQGDFASGTSSGSSKLVHGGLRYLRSGQWRLTLESVRERQRLLQEAPDIVERQDFLIPVYAGARPGKLALRLGLWIYDRMAAEEARSRWVEPDEVLGLEPDIRKDGLLGGMLYEDARTNDARLVMSLIVEACAAGASARNYTRVTGLLNSDGRTCGVTARDADGATREIRAQVVVDATGASAGRLQAGSVKLRPLRGSHFIFAAEKLPVRRAVSWLHPRDRRPIFAYPWEGVTLYGTTDLDHDGAPDAPPRMSSAEAAYLIEGLAHQFPALKLGAADALSCFSAVRPVVAGGKTAPSDESRESAMWSSPGLVGVTGGKLTTFRVTARQVLRKAAQQQRTLAPAESDTTLFRAPTSTAMRTQTRVAEDISLAGTRYSVTKLRYSARHEQVVHLDDLMLRRTRLGLITPSGGRALLSKLQPVCRDELGWSDERWRDEERRYLDLWAANHAPPTA